MSDGYFKACSVSNPAGKNLLKVSKIMLEQRLKGLCSNVISLTLNRFLTTVKNLLKVKITSNEHIVDFGQVLAAHWKNSHYKIPKLIAFL